MRHKDKSTSIRVALRLIVGLTTILFFLSFTHVLNAEDFTSHKGRFWHAKPVECGDTLQNGYYKMTKDLTCEKEHDPAIRITGPAKLNLNGYTLSSTDKKRGCIQIEGDGARVWNGTIKECRWGINHVEKSAYSKVINVTVSDCKKYGILIGGNEEGDEGEEGSNHNKFIKVRANNNGKRGFWIVKSSENFLINCRASENGQRGFSIEKNGDDNQLINCISESNGNHGFKIEEGDRNKIYYSKAIANCRDGIEIKGNKNLVYYNHVEDNGNPETCASYEEDYKPWYYAGIDVLSGSENNEIKFNRAGCNLGCVPCYDINEYPTCKARERDFWDENVDVVGECESNNVCNMWQNNRVVCKNVAPEYSPEPVEPE